MKNVLFALVFLGSACQSEIKVEREAETVPAIEGTWKLVYGHTQQGDSISVKDLSGISFIKMLNGTHFAFFNQPDSTAEGYYAGAGTYTWDGEQYKETLNFLGNPAWRGSSFEFTMEFVGDTLVQSGREEVPEAGVDRVIVEKYIRVGQGNVQIR